jgi:tRNA (guanine37-N1)-methyltransferase
MRADVVTLFPDLFRAALSTSILRIAQEKGLLDAHLTDLRDFATDRYRSVDDRPFGGGPGMVLKVEPVVKAVRVVRALAEPPGRLLIMCPQGRRLDQALAVELSREERLVLIAPRYEERIVELLAPERVSIGDVILSGGELPALCVLDAVVRLLPGALGDETSASCESFSDELAGGLEYPQYTRPAEFEGSRVPEVLLSGDHAKVRAWREEQAGLRTARWRPDLVRSQAGAARRQESNHDRPGFDEGS